MSAAIKSTKENKQRAVAMAVLEVIEKEGLLGVTHSKVSRKSGVSRAWIYEYIGQDKNAFIEFAADTIASQLTRIKMRLPDNKAELEKQLSEGLDFLFDSVMSDPVVIKLYFRFRGTANPIGKVIAKYEKQWLAGATKSSVKTLGLSSEQASLLAELALTLRLGFAHGLATSDAPGDARARAEKIFGYIHGMVAGVGESE